MAKRGPRVQKVIRMSIDEIEEEINIQNSITSIYLPKLENSTDEEQRVRFETMLERVKNRIEDCIAEVERRGYVFVCADDTKSDTGSKPSVKPDMKLERAAQEMIGELEMNALILARDPSIETICCTRLDGSTYLTTRRKARV